MKSRAWLSRRLAAFFGNVFCIGYSQCGCCKRAWPLVKVHHSTEYRRGRSMFPLCEACWKELTPLQRMPYYMKLIDSWEASSDGKNHNGQEYNDIRKAIFIAVLDGK